MRGKPSTCTPEPVLGFIVYGYMWLCNLKQLLRRHLADDMGLGKTLQVLSLLRLKQNGAKTLLVVLKL
jgi:SNF2 family DNA or RNA helicase